MTKTREICSICGAYKHVGILGGLYCPRKHGTGEWDTVGNQPRSDPE